MMIIPLCTRPTRLVGLLQSQLTETTCCSTGTHYLDSEPISLCSFFLTLLSQQRSNKYQFIIFGFTRSGIEPMIYRTPGEQVNHYTTDAVPTKCEVIIRPSLYSTLQKVFQHINTTVNSTCTDLEQCYLILILNVLISFFFFFFFFFKRTMS